MFARHNCTGSVCTLLIGSALYLVVASTSLAQTSELPLEFRIQSLREDAARIRVGKPYPEPTVKFPSPDDLRKKYPLESIAPRLKYESERATRQTSSERPRLGEMAREQLAKADAINPEEQAIRVKSLRMLHSDKVDEFVTKRGFGVGRMVTVEPSPRFLHYPESQPLAFKERPPQSSESESSETVALPERGVLEEAGGAWSPSFEMLSDFHAGDRRLFANPIAFGFIKDRQHVAGFRSHGFPKAPSLYHPDVIKNWGSVDDRDSPSERWEIGRLELVSLLKHERPVVYVSEHLPRMEELKDAKTRALSDFEQKALEKLIEGEEIVTEAHPNDIRLFGALRASKQCLKCHEASHGELLGAFSYDLFRDPPVKAKARRAVPST